MLASNRFHIYLPLFACGNENYGASNLLHRWQLELQFISGERVCLGAIFVSNQCKICIISTKGLKIQTTGSGFVGDSGQGVAAPLPMSVAGT